MFHFPKVVVSSVIRSSKQGESHGGVYIVDLETDSCEQVIDWNDPAINWSGRGGDRGLRGIALFDDKVYMAASDEIFVYDKDFDLVASFKNEYLKHCHEILIDGETLFITSTGYDAIMEFDLRSKSFVKGYHLRFGRLWRYLYRHGLGPCPALQTFDPNTERGPKLTGTGFLHINNVFFSDGAIYFSGTRIKHLFCISGEELHTYAKVPYRTHNAQPYKDGVLLNDTNANRVAYLDKQGQEIASFPIKKYPESDLQMAELPKDHARQGFARGLCVTDDGLLVAGSSPATVSVYRFGDPTALKTVNIAMDVRNTIHGLEIWPY